MSESINISISDVSNPEYTNQLENLFHQYYVTKPVQTISRFEMKLIQAGIFVIEYSKSENEPMWVFEIKEVHEDGSLTVISDESYLTDDDLPAHIPVNHPVTIYYIGRYAD